MLLERMEIEKTSFTSDIVRKSYHTADIFRKYGITFCCGGGWSLEAVCAAKGLEFEQLKKELELASRIIRLSPTLPFEHWNTDFLTNYITNIHHQYLKHSLPDTGKMLKHFADENLETFVYMQEVAVIFERLQKELLLHIEYEEKKIFPYVCQVVHAYENKDSYAKLLVTTLRKPLDIMMQREEDTLSALILRIRLLTNNYVIPDGSCVSHMVILCRLRELDSDMMQHIYLENEILFPRILAIERELLK